MFAATRLTRLRHDTSRILSHWILPLGWLALLTGMFWVGDRSDYHRLFYILLAAPTLLYVILQPRLLRPLTGSPLFIAFLAFSSYMMLSLSWSAPENSTGSLLKRPLYIALLFFCAAILALEWDVGYKIRALLLDDGTLEINYYERRTSVTGGRIVQVFEIDPAGYSSASARSYDSIKLLVKKVYIDSTISGLGLTNCNYWFNAFSNCTEVRGFENLSGMTSATQTSSLSATGSRKAPSSVCCPRRRASQPSSQSVMEARMNRMVATRLRLCSPHASKGTR